MREKQRIEQEISQRLLDPPKKIEPIAARKKVSSCPFTWNEESTRERFKHCTNCQSAIYNFDGIELPQAEALIFKRENRKKFVLYKREDGKYMTSDCPVAKRRRAQIAGLVAAGFCLVVCLALVLMMMPPAPPPTASNPTATGSPDVAKTDRHWLNAPSAVSTGGDLKTQHYVEGQPIPTTPASDSANNQTQKSYSDSEEKGEFWQFPNGQNADHPGSSN